ncbi:thioredoxin-like 1-2, chloroplastic isoform X1 [Miscanthus floridulus]|uniref:thioredoxin-like 1-2, chloroplastic isoform X1 n=1 Tax=Miscanthus floridulus TaxID=154761 RepID=UPI00345815EA
MAAAQAMAKGSVGSLGRRRGAEAARVGGSWRKSSFLGGRLAVGPRRPGPVFRILVTSPAQSFDMAASSSLEQMNLSFGKAMKWWQKGLQPNMRAIQTAQDLVDSLTDAGDGLVVVDFFSPGCAGCHALHPKICQFAERNSDVQFLQVNYEEHKSMCYSLHVHVFPFFRFYRGAQGRLCSFSCTNATIKKFRDVLAKHRADRCSLGPTRGLEESELLALAANMDLQFTYTKELELAPSMEDVTKVIAADRPRLPTVTTPLARQGSEDRALVSSGR